MRYILLVPIIIMLSNTIFSQTPELFLEHGGIVRSYLLYIPDSYTGDDSVPLVFVLHGGGGDAVGIEKLTRSRFNTLAEEHNFIVVYPNGVDKHWNDGRVGDIKNASQADDVGFISALIDELSANYNIDANKVFSTGMSNGGLMSYRLACELNDRIAGIAPVTATLSNDLSDSCVPQHAIDMLIMLGTDDPLMPYDGGLVGIWGIERGTVLSADENLSFWTDRFNCADTFSSIEYPNRALFDGTNITEVRYERCDEANQVNLMTIHGGGHTWAGGWQYLSRFVIGKTSRDINATEVIWEFFASSGN
jgi:polyhydroxybutyrate depolymerase